MHDLPENRKRVRAAFKHNAAGVCCICGADVDAYETKYIDGAGRVACYTHAPDGADAFAPQSGPLKDFFMWTDG